MVFPHHLIKEYPTAPVLYGKLWLKQGTVLRFLRSGYRKWTGLMRLDDREKSEKFREAATRRVRNVETTLRRVRNLSNPTSYEYTEDEIMHISEHLQTVLDRTRDSFQRPKDQQQFSL